MVIREVPLERVPSQDAVLYINKSGITFSARFIKKEGLEKAESVKFFLDDEDPHFLGFMFFEEVGVSNTLSLMASGRSKGGSAGATIKAAELINSNPILKSIQKLPRKQDRTFEISKDRKTGIYSISLRPTFEISLSWENRNQIPDSYLGIYRYVNRDGQVIYIGKGSIKSRANSPERKEWGISRIEYSVLSSDEECFRWESYYIDRYVEMNGARPPLNLVMGKNSKLD